MKTIKLNLKKMVVVVLLLLSAQMLLAQKMNIPDGGFITIGPNNGIVTAGTLNIGGGTSGTLTMQGSFLTVTGTINLASGSTLDLANGTISFTNYNYDANSTVKFSGTSQTVMNHNYGKLLFAGTGIMQITGDATTPTTCTDFTVNNTGNSVLIPENKALTITGITTNNAGVSSIKVLSSLTGDGSLISSTACNVTVQRFCAGTQWHYISAPISNALSANFPTGHLIAWDATMQWAGVGDYAPWATYGATNLLPSQGYGYYAANDQVAFQGLLNVGNYTQVLYKNASGTSTYQGWNLIGNPYSSAIDWDIAVANGAVPVGAENAIYFFDDTNASGQQSNYKYYVPSTGGTYGIGTNTANKNIPMGQAFFVKTNTDNILLNLKNTYRIHNQQTYYRNDQSGILRLQVAGNQKTDETILRIVNGTSNAFDASYDAHKLFPTNNLYPFIYSIDKDTESGMAINSIAQTDDGNIIPLGFKAIEGQYTFSVSELSIYTDEIYLVDTQSDIKTDITDNFSYTFNHAGGVSEGRFFIYFGNNTTDIAQQTSENTFVQLYPNPASSQFTLSGISKNTHISISDISGKLVFTSIAQSNSENININNLSNGVYFVKIQNNNKTIIKKFNKTEE